MLIITLCTPLFFFAPEQTNVDLSQGTADISQVNFPPSEASDGLYDMTHGWATNGQTAAACWETSRDLSAGKLHLSMYFLFSTPEYLLANFRFSVTGDNRTTFADGVANGGAVSANWTVLTDPDIVLPPGLSYSILEGESILIRGTPPARGVFHLSFDLDSGPVTGIRLDVEEFAHAGPYGGPGFFGPNGNFVLSELEASHLDTPRLKLAASGVAAGQQATLRVKNATPGGLVQIVYSNAGYGTSSVFVGGGCGSISVDMAAPALTTLAPTAANSSGFASVPVNVPIGMTGLVIWLQAVDLTTCRVSPAVHRII